VTTLTPAYTDFVLETAATHRTRISIGVATAEMLLYVLSFLKPFSALVTVDQGRMPPPARGLSFYLACLCRCLRASAGLGGSAHELEINK
jgi:hypothetical protein